MRGVIRFAFVLGALVLSAAMAQTVRADETFDITWTGGYGAGSATVTATDEGGGSFLVDSIISGTQAGSTISYLDVPEFYGLNDNYIFPGSTALVDVFGLAFDVSGTQYNIFLFGDQYVECSSAFEGPCISTAEEEAALPLTSFAISEVAAPEPGSLLLLSLGLAGLIGAGIYRKRTFVGMPA